MSYIGTPKVGLDGTSNFGTDDLVLDVERMVVVHDRQSAPLMTWLSHTAGRMVPTTNEDFYWQEVQYDYTKHVVAAGFTGGAATVAGVNIDSPEVVAGDTFAHPDSGQYFIVDSVTRDSVSSTMVLRGIGGNVQTVAVNAILVPCGIALGDGGYYPEAKGIKPTRKANTVTTRTTSVEITHAADKAATYFGSVRQMNNERQIAKFRKDMERDMLHSSYAVLANYSQANPNGTRVSTIRFTRGVLKGIQTNVQTYTGDLDEDTWDEFLGTMVFNNEYAGSADKLAFIGPTSNRKLHKSLKGRLRILGGPGQNKYGLRIMEYETAAGNTVMFFQEKNFMGISPYDKGCMILDPAFIKLRHYGSNLMEIFDTSVPRQSARSLSVESTYGVELQFETAHALLKQAG